MSGYDGYALVIKAGSNISKYGELIIPPESDWIEKSLYDEYLQKSNDSLENRNIVLKYDILLASTGDGTLGKCCVFDKDIPAIADTHVTIIRVDKSEIDPYYLADYLRYGLGARQIQGYYSGSTGLIELTPDYVESIFVDHTGKVKNIDIQRKLSISIRKSEKKFISQIQDAHDMLENAIINWS